MEAERAAKEKFRLGLVKIKELDIVLREKLHVTFLISHSTLTNTAFKYIYSNKPFFLRLHDL